MIADPSVRQEVFSDLREYFTEAIGEVAFSRFVAMLPTTLKMIFANEGDRDAWVGAREFAILLAAVDMQVHPMLADFGAGWGRHFVVARAPEFVGDLSSGQLDSLSRMFQHKRTTSILHVAARLQKGLETLPRWFQPLELAVDERVSPSQLVFNTQARPANLPLFCNVLAGLAGGILELHRIPYLRIHEEFCMTSGHLACSFVILFEPETPLSFF